MSNSMLRVGHGFDIHRLVPDRLFMLGGVKVDHDRGCEAHSDGDVLLHALIDSLLGACGAGDIGLHFPDSDEQYRGVASSELLAQTMSKLPASRIINVDITVFCEVPKLGPLREAIGSAVAGMLGIGGDAVNLKYKTMEKLGAIGSGDAVAASVVTLIELEG